MTWVLQRERAPLPRSTPDPVKWFDGKFSDDAADKALAGIEAWLTKTYGEKAVMRSTPAGVGMALLLLTLPLTAEKQPISYPVLPDGMTKLLHATSFPHRWETFDKTQHGIEYDARGAFVAYCRHVPCWFGRELMTDDQDQYIPFQPARYFVDVTVPHNWQHIGLVPAEHVAGERYRAYPATPGTSWSTWLDDYEMFLLEKHRWPYHIRKRLLFAERETPGADPLRKWIDPIVSMLGKIEMHANYHQEYMKAFRYGIRAIALRTIGRFHTSGGAEVVTIDPTTGDIEIEQQKQLNDFTTRFHHPEWSSHIWSRSRVKATEQALLIPREKLLYIHADAIGIATDTDPHWEDTGKVGCYRTKGSK